MIDTMDIVFNFKTKTDYNFWYTVFDNYSYNMKKMRLHKKLKNTPTRYITTAFAKHGLLEIAFIKSKYSYSIQIIFQPIRLLFPNEYIKLSSFTDYLLIEKNFNTYINSLNICASDPLLYLPHLKNWRVLRVDYAINYYTPYLKSYLKLFHKGAIPKGFSGPYPDENSFYLFSKNGNINFYDKIDQLNKKKIIDLPHIHNILRLEFQCSNKYIQHLKKQFNIKTAYVPAFWNTHIANKTLKKRVSSIIGKNDFYSLKQNNIHLKNILGHSRIYSLCNRVQLDIINSPNLLHAKAHFCTDMHCTSNYFDQILTKIRTNNINPITLDAISNDSNSLALNYLPNPYKEIFY